MARPAGIDVSRWQGPIDWPAVKSAGIAFASIRATIGNSYTDDRFVQNWQGARAAGLFRAAYHVLRPDHDPTSQIARFAEVVGEPGDLPHVLDVELTGEQPDRVIRERTLACLQEMEARFGRKPVVYTADWFWTPHIGAQPWVADYDLWVAHYYWPTVTEPKVPAGWSAWRFWQHSNRGQVAGIPARVDLDFFNGTLGELIEYAGGDPNPPPAPDLDQRVRNLERWAAELDAWARGQGYDGVRPTGTG